jgi:hypothetical protein
MLPDGTAHAKVPEKLGGLHRALLEFVTEYVCCKLLWIYFAASRFMQSAFVSFRYCRKRELPVKMGNEFYDNLLEFLDDHREKVTQH